MSTTFTRRRFLSAAGAGMSYLALTSAAGCDLRERTPVAKTPKGRPLPTPKVWPLQNVSSAPSKGVWSFRSRPDLGPPAVEVSTQAHHTAPGYIFVAPKLGRGQHGPMIIDNLGEPVWFRKGNLHDFLITPQDTALLTVYTQARGDLSPLGGLKEGPVVEGIAQEVDIESGEVLFEWHSLEHVRPEESYHKLHYGKYFDYFHINSIDVDHDNN